MTPEARKRLRRRLRSLARLVRRRDEVQRMIDAIVAKTKQPLMEEQLRYLADHADGYLALTEEIARGENVHLSDDSDQTKIERALKRAQLARDTKERLASERKEQLRRQKVDRVQMKKDKLLELARELAAAGLVPDLSE